MDIIMSEPTRVSRTTGFRVGGTRRADAAMRREADARMNECMTGPFWEDSTKVPFCYRPPFLKMDN